MSTSTGPHNPTATHVTVSGVRENNTAVGANIINPCELSTKTFLIKKNPGIKC